MAKTNTGLVAYAKANIGNPYWYGTFGQVGTQALLDSKRRQYPSFYTNSMYAKCKKDIGNRVHDFFGVIALQPRRNITPRRMCRQTACSQNVPNTAT